MSNTPSQHRVSIDVLATAVGNFLGEGGLLCFRTYKREFGTPFPVLRRHPLGTAATPAGKIPYRVWDHEGMQVRRFLSQLKGLEWTLEEADERTPQIVERALLLYERTLKGPR